MNDLRLFVIVVLSVLPALFSCTMPTTGRGGVKGVVTLSSTGEPVENVKVQYSNLIVNTDAAGCYSFDDIPDGLQGITFSKTGFTSVVSMVEVPRDAVVENNVTIDVMSNGWAVGNKETEYGTIFYSEDGGVSWVRQGGYTVIPFTNLLCVCAVNRKTCWVAGDTTFNVSKMRMEFSILKTSDAGEHWRRQGASISTLSPCPIVGVTAVDTSTVFAVTDTNMILKGTKGGEQWSLCHTSQYCAKYEAISTSDGVHIWAGGTVIEGGASGLDYSSDGGSTWKFVSIPVAGDTGYITCISAVDTQMVYITGNFGVLRTTDKGSTWEKVFDDKPYSTLATLGSFCGWAADEDGGLRYSSDAFAHSDASSIEAPVDDMYITAISFLGNGKDGAFSYFTGEVLMPGGILHSADGGKNWTEAVTPYKVAVNEISFAGTRH